MQEKNQQAGGAGYNDTIHVPAGLCVTVLAAMVKNTLWGGGPQIILSTVKKKGTCRGSTRTMG